MLDISGGLLIASAAIFLTMMVLLNNWLFKPLLKFMDDRDSSIKRDLENVSKNSNEVDELFKEAEEIVAKAKIEAGSIRERATLEAKKLFDAKILAKREELDRDYSQFLTSLKAERVEVKNALMSQVPLFKENLKAKFSQL
jgi:F-type H+-transporting ATPase subunit b